METIIALEHVFTFLRISVPRPVCVDSVGYNLNPWTKAERTNDCQIIAREAVVDVVLMILTRHTTRESKWQGDWFGKDKDKCRNYTWSWDGREQATGKSSERWSDRMGRGWRWKKYVPIELRRAPVLS